MSLFTTRRTRSTRGSSLRAGTSITARLMAMLRDSGLLLRLSVVAVALLALLVVVQAWTPGFPHRWGDRVETGIAARVDFRRINLADTERAREDRELLVPYVFRQDSEPLRSLPALLRSHLSAVAEADQLSQLVPEAVAAFGLTSRNGTEVQSKSNSQEFATLKSAVSSRGDSVGSTIDEVVKDFEQFIAPLNEVGVLRSEWPPGSESAGAESSPLRVRGRGRQPFLVDDPDHAIVIVTDSTPERSAVLADIRLSEQIKESGLLGKNWSSYPHLSSIRPMLERWMRAQIPGTLQFKPADTQRKREEAIASVGAVYDHYPRGLRLAEPGAVIDNETLALLQAEQKQLDSAISVRERCARVATVLMLLTVTAVFFGCYLVRQEPKIAASAKQLVLFLTCCIAAVGLSRLMSFDPWRAEIIPVLALTMLFAIAYNQVLAMLTAFAVALIVSLSTVVDIGHFVVLVGVCMTAIVPLSSVPSRSRLITVGFMCGIVCFLVSWGTGVIGASGPADVWYDHVLLSRCLKGAGWCVVCGFLVSGSLPFVEKLFGVVTDISLLEMSDISHPLLRELVRRAPGTYNHSIAVATIAETAADAIGANGLLVRVGAYFHDIGKMLKPEYFIENIIPGTESRHQHLAPAMSTLIIIGHVKDGADLARQHNLPRQLISFIEQHHGTTLVEYFFREAERQVDRDHKKDAEESSFRYPGPKPQTPEAGVMMLADAVESASRTLSDPTPRRIETLVHQLAMKRLLDGQFDECSLTLKQIHTIEESLVKSLIGIYHGRVKYPEQQRA